MKLKKNSLIILALLTASCSFNGNQQQKTIAELGDSVDGDSLQIVETKEDGVVEIFSSQVEDVENVIAEEPVQANTIMDNPAPMIAHNEEVKEEIDNVISNDRYEDYVVQKGDTLMILAFRLYRDVMMWKDIAGWNSENLNGGTKIYPGDKLKVKVVDFEGNIWQPQGNPYLIQDGDSLMRVSQNVYDGTTRYWRDIWENNTYLIKDPNIIYAGFTLYYLPVEEIKQNKMRDLASKGKDNEKI
ncbi:LysM peptidoglycan-binding domain-containing protein [Bacteriovorax sp. Seq25_V]|uniref:LysM peptidoglycan-binding domain-containing protein n=1 Tax=Bacteriovorax sp. Seq25_V TaxID=1201288 RepID=UPI000389F9C1|nr:LysM domain-containing protein [Bacteriovorax sp. Seq25_V]EQC45346.1 LysM domain protein [Bacteriovorax sp. Seq25_V]